MKVLALSGSLRVASINTMLLRAAVRLAPTGIAVDLFDRLGGLPLFNPDIEADPPPSVMDLRRRVSEADALVIASPEYAHGITGPMKNALDWLVGHGPFAGKPVAVLNASPRAHHADDALREVLRTMAAVIVEPASITIPLLAAKLDEDGMVNTPWSAAAIRESLEALRAASTPDGLPSGPAFPMR
ncbi:NADPH-dependent FMN reductase [Piscinibacter terrae]|uniref:NAD(P)H-dependent oxidoreductase n=1 Tax=Piscinibacter terrae TaxID=2496871 RepID=A0A3N7HQI1_9BURK|nr:NADPH-dependent FMN reductase [Albitalea terrae]RQP24454.1 NAD(P)H-dependent oxidoreductase [Albitalea terrae]